MPSGTASSPSPPQPRSASPTTRTPSPATPPVPARAEPDRAPSGSLVAGQAEAKQAGLQGFVRNQAGHGAAVHDAAIVHHRDAVAQRTGHVEVLLPQQDGGDGLLQR